MKPATPSTHIRPRQPHRLRRWVFRILGVTVVLVIVAELVARFGLGLGDPPLMMTDAEIEYLYRPSHTYNRFGNVVAINQWSMRSDEFAAAKSDPNELRIVLIGDSVINGGAQTDQADIATEIIRRELPARVNRPVVVGNVSAGSWGPMNMLAYARKFGFFDADVVIIVLSSHDWNDAPTFEPLGPDMPTRRPLLALQEAIERYLPRYLPALLGGNEPNPLDSLVEPAPSDPEVIKSLTAARELVALAQRSGAKVVVAAHLERNETMDHLKPGHDAIGAALRELDVNIIQLGPSFAQARQTGGQPYRDDIHPNQLGQRVIAKVLADWIVAMIREDAPPAMPSSMP